jgi:phosphate transport system substrate-binding protein
MKPATTRPGGSRHGEHSPRGRLSRRLAAAAIAATALTAAAPARAAAAPPTITMSGAAISRSLVADLAYFYGHAVRNPPRFSLVASSTNAGIADVKRAIVEGGMVSRNLGATDPSGLVLTPLALSGVCLVANRANPVPGITREQLQDIVAARVTSWSQIPGSARTDAIVPVTLDPSTGTRLVFDSVFLDIGTPILYAARTFDTSPQVRDFIEATPAAFGYVDLASAGPLHTLTYQGVACTRDTVRKATYPAQRPLGVVTLGKPRGALKRFLQWVATSRKARQVIATRYIPYNAP